MKGGGGGGGTRHAEKGNGNERGAGWGCGGWHRRGALPSEAGARLACLIARARTRGLAGRGARIQPRCSGDPGRRQRASAISVAVAVLAAVVAIPARPKRGAVMAFPRQLRETERKQKTIAGRRAGRRRACEGAGRRGRRAIRRGRRGGAGSRRPCAARPGPCSSRHTLVAIKSTETSEIVLMTRFRANLSRQGTKNSRESYLRGGVRSRPLRTANINT